MKFVQERGDPSPVWAVGGGRRGCKSPYLNTTSLTPTTQTNEVATVTDLNLHFHKGL